MKRKKKTKRERKWTPLGPTLASAGVELIKEIKIHLRCKACGKTWTVVTENGKWPVDSWLCPEMCHLKKGGNHG